MTLQMTSETWWYGRAAALLGVIALFVLGWLLFGEHRSSGQEAIRNYVKRRHAQLRFLRSNLTGVALTSAQALLLSAGLAWALAMRQWLPLLILPIVALLPGMLLHQMSMRRVTRIEEQIELWLNAVANSLKASPSLGEAIASTITLVPVPMSEEVDVLVKEYELGTPLDQAFYNFQQRVESRTLAGTLLALKVARHSGGDLPHMLETAARALRELARLEGVVRTKTAEGKAQAFVIGVIPIPMVLGIGWIEPSFFEPLFATFVGNFIMAMAAILWLAAVLLAHKILRVDV